MSARLGRFLLAVLLILPAALALAADGNRLAYLDEPLNPYYPHRDFPKLITPQWVGEEGVDCVVTLAIDDMRDPAKYEAFLRPILERLKKIDGRAPVSIMTCQVKPDDPQLQAWLKEGLSIECHTFDHPCPCLKDGTLATAKETYDKCVDLINQIPNNKPVAFRMPCCDSLNTPSPRFWAEVFNKTTPKGNFLQIDSSVFNIITKDDKELPKEITLLPSGEERFRRYIPFKNFVNTIEDYPYPYVIGRMCWEFPCVVPSDWSAQHVQKPNNPDTVRDLKLALDAVLLKKGVYNLVFHPHGWIRSEQIIDLIDHAVTKHGKKVKFLTFRECAARLNENLFSDISLPHISVEQRLKNVDRMKMMQEDLPRYAKLAAEPALVDVNADGYLDVRFHLNLMQLRGRDWLPKENRWQDRVVKATERFELSKMAISEGIIFSKMHVDLDGDGIDEFINPSDKPPISQRSPSGERVQVKWGFPNDIYFQHPRDGDSGLRLIDINGDKKLDCLFSNSERYCLYLFKDMKEGWATKVFDEVRGKETGTAPVIPPFVRADGTNNGAFFHSGALCVINEDTNRLPNHVQIITFAEMLKANPDKASGGRPEKASGGRQPPGDDAPPKNPPLPKDPTQGKPTGKLTHPARRESAREENDSPPPLSPAEALASFTLRPGMKIELVACEPLVVDPVAFDWGPDGRLWVVEMRDYPNGIDWHQEGDPVGKAGGRVKVFSDTDGDGKYDKADIFLDEVPFPTGVKVWRKGILVTAAPDILYAEDTTGDNKADVRNVLYRGFGEGNQQHRVNGLRWGLDNWLHVGNGDSGGVIKSEITGEQVNVGGRDLRIRPDEGKLETTSGNTQFGRERNDWGDWFGNNNSNPIFHYVLDDHYLRRNPHFAPPGVTRHIQAAPGAAPVFPKSKTLARFNDFNMSNRFTSACSTTIYRDDLLGPEFYGNFFTCEPVHNLVHREPITPDGVTFKSERAEDEQQSEFLASSDNWFRPSMVRTGPDGAIWISDMYRFVIEHPKWIPPETQKKLDLRAGDDKGRIYRIYPADARPRQVPRLDRMTTEELVAQLESTNGIVRDLAHQMILWNSDKEAIGPLEKIVQESASPQARLHALCILDGLGELKEKSLLVALGDEQAAIRRHAIRLSELRLRGSERIATAVLKHLDEVDSTIRLQLAYSLGEWTDPQAARGLAKLAVENHSDPYITAAVMSSLTKVNVGEVLTGVLAGNRGQAPPEKLVEKILGIAAALGDEQVVSKAIAIIVTPKNEIYEPWQFAALAGLFDALDRRGTSLASLLDDAGKEKVKQLFDVARGGAGIRAQAENPANFLAAQVAMTRLLGRGLDEQENDLKLLSTLLSPQMPVEVQSAAVGSLGRLKQPGAAAALLDAWASHSPTLRGQILDTLLSRGEWSAALIDAVEQGRVPGSQIDARRRQQILAMKDAALRSRAEKVLAGAVDANRAKVIEQYKPALAATGDKERGKAVFAKRCANCHRLEGVGHLVGSDLAAMANRAPDVYLIAVLDPNRAVEDRYLDYAALTADGKTHTGILVGETGNSITLAQPEGKQVQILRSDLEQLKSTGKSLMPEGVEKDITVAEMADLIAYLRGSGPPPKNFPGNNPEVVRPYVDGSIRLTGLTARIYGPTAVLEEKYRNIGWWQSEEDHVAWSLESTEPGEYRVVLDYACDNGAAGDRLVVTIAGQTLGWKVEGTGTWDNYRGKDIGTVKLDKGPAELIIRSDGPVKSALIDLRGIRLTPVK